MSTPALHLPLSLFDNVTADPQNLFESMWYLIEASEEDEPDGFTLDSAGIAVDRGFAVAIPDKGVTLPKHPAFARTILRQWTTLAVNDSAESVGPDDIPAHRCFGGWKPHDVWMIEPTLVFLDRNDAIIYGSVWNQDSIYHLDKGEVIEL